MGIGITGVFLIGSKGILTSHRGQQGEISFLRKGTCRSAGVILELETVQQASSVRVFVFFSRSACKSVTMDRQWMELGREIGLSGDGLLDFVREREQAARETRVQEMELRRQDLEIKRYEHDILQTKMQMQVCQQKYSPTGVRNSLRT